MKRLAILALAILFGIPCFPLIAQRGLRGPSLLANLPKAAAPTGAFFSEGFEGAGYEKGSGAPNGWGESGTVINEDYTATVLDGAQSLFMDAAAGFFYNTNVWAAGAKSEVWGYARFRVVVSAANSIRLNLVVAASSDEFVFEIANDSALNKIRVYNGTVASSFGSRSVLPSNAQTYEVLFHYKKKTGSNDGIAQAWLAVGTIPGVFQAAPDCEVTTGDSANNVDAVSFQATTSDQVIWDKLILSTVRIPSNP